jgi:hypothetical protein
MSAVTNVETMEPIEDTGAKIVETMGEPAARELLEVLLRSPEDRAALIGRLHARGGRHDDVAQMLIDLEADDAARWEVTDALRAVLR